MLSAQTAVPASKKKRGEVVGTVSKTLSSQESQLAIQQDSYVAFEESMPSVGYATGGVIERGRAAMGSSASSSSAGSHHGVDMFAGVAMPRTYAPLTVEWPQESGEWSLVTDDDDEEPEEA